MYMPSHFKLDDLAQARRLIEQQPLGLLLGRDPQGASFASHLPLFWGAEGEHWWLDGHLARANPQSAWLADQPEQLLVFSGPDAYVSPRHYEHERNVPTWNYLALHLRVRTELIDEPAAKDALLKRLIARHEPGYAAQWRGLPEDFQHKLLGAIVGLRLHVLGWEFKAKLSQNRSALERRRLREQLEAGTPRERELAGWMQDLGL